jgi:hypothetical protein
LSPPEVISIIRLYDALLDLFCVEMFESRRCDEDIDILCEGMASTGRR